MNFMVLPQWCPPCQQSRPAVFVMIVRQHYLPWSYQWCLAGKRHRRSSGRSGSCGGRTWPTCCPGTAGSGRCPGPSPRPAARTAGAGTAPCTGSRTGCSASQFCCGRLDSKGEWPTPSSSETDRHTGREIPLDTLRRRLVVNQFPPDGTENPFIYIDTSFALTWMGYKRSLIQMQ